LNDRVLVCRYPLVTVYLPTFNRVDLLRRAVDSVRNQSFQNFELIVVDDNSSDSTVDYLKSLTATDKRIRWLCNSVNSGACVSRNKAINEARGEFITGLDDDDYLAPNHLESLLSAWRRRNEGIIAIYPETIRVFKDGEKRAAPKLGQCVFDDLLCTNWIGNQVFVPTDALRKIGGFDERFPAWQDYECWYRLLKVTGEKAVCSRSYTYYLDASHDHARISSSSVQRIYDAWSLFCSAHDLSSKEAEIVKLMLASYGIKDIDLRFLVHKILRMPHRKNFKHALLIFVKHFNLM